MLQCIGHPGALDWIYVDDVIGAYVRAAVAPGIEGETLDVGSGTAVTIRRIAPGIEPPFGAVTDRPGIEPRTADLERTFSRIGWRPGTSLGAGLDRTVAWYRLHAA